MKRFAMLRQAEPSGWTYGPGLEAPAMGTGRRRVMVFCGVFLLVAVVGLTYTFARPAQYRAAARLQITPPAGLDPAPLPVPASSGAGGVTIAAPAAGADPAQSLLGQIQFLTSRPLLEQTLERLSKAGKAPAGLEGGVDGLEARLGAAAVDGTQVVQLWAEGREPPELPLLVNTLIEVYTQHLADLYHSSTTDSLERAREEAAKLEQQVAARRAQVREFQLRHDIVSQEREEHSVLNRARAMNTALSAANERLVKAEAQLRSLQESAAAGRRVVRSKDNPTLADMEQRASLLREELRDLERRFAPAYLAMDPQVQAKQARLVELEEQIRTERRTSEKGALADAEEEVDSARSTVSQLQQKLAGDRRETQEFSLRFNEYKGMQLELGELEALQRGAEERMVRLEASEGARRPTVEVIEWAEEPREASSPDYGRDAAISLGAALGLGLFAVWLVDYLRPRPTQQPGLAMPQIWMPLPVSAGGPLPAALPVGTTPARLPLAPSFPRELASAEVACLLAAADAQARVAVAALLAGASGEEVRALRWEDVDLEAGDLEAGSGERCVLRIGGAAPRELPVVGPLRAALEAAGLQSDPPPAGPVLHDGQGRALGAAELDGLLLAAAHDAGLDAPAEVSAAALRHTYVAYLVRQGARFADLPAVLGPLAVEALAAYSSLAPAGPRIPAERVDWVYRCEPAGSSGRQLPHSRSL